MVVFPPACPPTILNAYSKVSLDPNVRSMVQREFDIGAFARFQNPSVAINIHDRADFHNKSNLEIREQLDRENITEAFAVIDADTANSRAIWWVTSKKESNYWTETYTEERGLYPPISYPGEAFVLWQLHLVTQDLPLQWVNWDIGNIAIPEEIGNVYPYDPHDTQNPPFTLGKNFSDKHEAKGFYFGPWVTANYSEVVWSNDTELRKRWMPVPPWVVRLTNASAHDAGLISSWTASFWPHPQQSDHIKLQQNYDWDSPKWAWNGGIKKPLIRRAVARRNAETLHSAPISCQKAEVVNISSNITRTLPGKPIPALTYSEKTS